MYRGELQERDMLVRPAPRCAGRNPIPMTSGSKNLTPRARDLALRLAAFFKDDRVLSEFVDGYVAKFSRQGIVVNPVQRRDLWSAIRREALLGMLARIQTQLPQGLTSRRPPVLKGAEVRAAENFRQESIAALGRAFLWLPHDVEAFRRDLDLYEQLGARQPAAAGQPAPPQLSASTAPLRPTLRTHGFPEEGPFVDRVAFLLDPSLMEKARTAAGKFLKELEAIADQVLAATLQARR